MGVTISCVYFSICLKIKNQQNRGLEGSTSVIFAGFRHKHAKTRRIMK